MATAKYFVIGCLGVAVIAAVIVVGVVGGIFYLGLGKHIDTVEAQGMEFGRKTDQQACKEETIRRLKSAKKSVDLIREQDAYLFIYGCFETCRPTSGFCLDAPKEDSFFTVRKWAQDRCRLEGAPEGYEPCVSVFEVVAHACLGKIEHK
ncbi:MAG TPA: hypothetical protein VKD91_17155 [Pyrinomonadaceae bacterium]|nr:hypothetical protein [Pyrinomonadaceae bacterium]